MVGIEGLEPPRISPRASKTRAAANYAIRPIKWSEWQDLNLQHLAPKASALAKLSYIPIKMVGGKGFEPLALTV